MLSRGIRPLVQAMGIYFDDIDVCDWVSQAEYISCLHRDPLNKASLFLSAPEN